MVNKIYCCIVSILFLGTCFSGRLQTANASDAARYMSNRIKIIRPEKTVKAPSVKDSDTISSKSPGIVFDSKKPASLDMQVDMQDKKMTKQAALPEAGREKGDRAEEADSVMTEEMLREEITNLIGAKEQFYSRKGRIDPFEPFLRQPEPDMQTEEQIQLERRTPRTPLEKIDLSQLKLTAVLRTPTKTKALVQESSGKGYIVSQGTYIGNKGGQVSEISKNRIMVEEKYLDVFGKVSVRERELKLQQ